MEIIDRMLSITKICDARAKWNLFSCSAGRSFHKPLLSLIREVT
jgi:hypothetical protein